MATEESADDECPDCTALERGYVTALGRQVRREHARYEMVLGSIRAHLQEQPTRALVRAAARRWCTAIHQAADEISRAA